MEEESKQQSSQLESPEEESDDREKIVLDEDEGWGWNKDAGDIIDETHGNQTLTALIPSEEIRLRARVDELEDKIRDLEAEKEKLEESHKTVQLRSEKLVRKLKEYKVQNNSLQQQLNIHKSGSDFFDLDSAIVEELKSQLSSMERTLGETKEECKKAQLEKENLIKRLDVLVAANERLMEIKERQDRDVEVMQIQISELIKKVRKTDSISIAQH